ncbi:MAG: T9SS type A sorting domain-containing protein, partial [candidate division WOR-3 bacterium]
MYQINKLTLWVILMAVTLAIAQPPTLLLPPNDSIIFNQYPFFDWEDVSGATSYRLQVADVPNFVTMLLDTTVENSQCTSEISLAQSDTLCIYYWRVFVEVPEGETSDVWTFGLLNKGPDLISPEPNAELNDETPTFLWYHQPGSQKYSIVVWGEVSPVVDDTITDTTYTCSVSLTNGLYTWDIKACDCMNNWSPASTRSFSISDNIPPAVPTLVSPDSGATINHNPTFSWNPVDEAVLYNLIVESETKTEIININTTGTAFTPVPNLSQGTYTWKVKAKDINNNWSNFSNPWLITIIYETPGWTQKQPVNTNLVPAVNNVIKDGGALVGVGNELYAFIGTKTNVFRKYTIGTKSGWETVESLPFGFKYKPETGVDTTARNKKFVGKGAALCYDGVSKIYATRGNGTWDFWVYDINNPGWTMLKHVPTPKGKPLKIGTALTYYNGNVYLLAGGHKPTDTTNFYAYNVADSTWTKLAGLECSPTYKPLKAGTAMTVLDGIIYAIKGGDQTNKFLAYDIAGDSWIYKQAIPEQDTVFGHYKKKVLVKDGGCLAAGDGAIYAIKGNATDVFWKYTPGNNLWQRLEAIPVIDKKHAPKTGAAMAYANGKIWLLVGNKQPDFWCYTIGAGKPVNPEIIASASSKITNETNKFNFDILPNPFEKMATIRYTVPTAGNVIIKLYNASGRLIETLANEYLTAGNYTLTLSAEKLAKGIYFVKCETSNNS